MTGGTRPHRAVLLLLLLVGVAAPAASGVVTDGEISQTGNLECSLYIGLLHEYAVRSLDDFQVAGLGNWQAGLLPNGNFEQGPNESQMNDTRVMSPNAIPHWEISGFVEYIGSGQQQDDMILPVPEGARAVRLGNDATIRQLLSVTRKKAYSITFCAARTCAQAEKLNVSIGSESGELPIQTVMSDTKVVKYVDAAHHAVPRGARAVELVAGSEAALLQEVPTTPGRWYRLSFSVGDAGNGCAQPLAVRAAAASSSQVVTYESRGTGGSRRGELEFAAAADVTRVVFQSAKHHMKPDGTLCGPVVDDVSLVGVRKRAARRLFM
ncbi:hypothetical protein C2845_PM15G12910 [Panicum miliaceum]|uniref:DUF642 domain-containing protein n=1 Tax=Panicum miliaceum TaxID=4540 RepID=A0A3L6QA47_PANMI|nr:hypothetical protein C2845_PM15G12910 [Panicum miliaceum]